MDENHGAAGKACIKSFSELAISQAAGSRSAENASQGANDH
jgi:hypothetical protein